jgi:hypothetical protein
MALKSKLLCLLWTATCATAQEYDAVAKKLKFELQQATPTTYNTSSYVVETSLNGQWAIGLSMRSGDGSSLAYIVLNDNSGPVMVVDMDSGCSTCTSGTGGSWYVGNAGFSIQGSTGAYEWFPAANPVYSYTDANVSIGGTLGTVSSSIYISSTGLDLFVPNTPILAVSQYQMTNTSFFLNEFQFYGSVGFGRPSATNPAPSSYLTALTSNNIINSTTWAYQPYGTAQQTGYIEIGGYNESNIVSGTLKWTPSPVVTGSPDKWSVSVSDL